MKIRLTKKGMELTMKKVKAIFILLIALLVSYLLASTVIAQGEYILLKTNKEKV